MLTQPEILTNVQQYRYELSLLPRLTQEEERVLTDQAREGDKQARDRLIEGCLRYITFIAARYKRYVHHDDYLDLVSVGNLAVVENVEKALTMDNPQAYLCVTAKLAIIEYCMTRASLITKSRYSNASDPSVSSLDAPVYQDSDISMLDLIAAPEAEPERKERDYTQLHKAISTLPEKYREVLTRHYGLYGRPAESLYGMSREMSACPGPKSSAAYLIEYRALARLRSRLESIA